MCKLSGNSHAQALPTGEKSFSQNQYLGSVLRWEGGRAFPVRYMSLEIASLDGNLFKKLAGNDVRAERSGESALSGRVRSIRSAFGPVLLQLAIERGLADAQQSRRRQLVSVGLAQRAQDGAAFHFVECGQLVGIERPIAPALLQIGGKIAHVQNGPG